MMGYEASITMYYDKENDKLISINGDFEIYPINDETFTFKGTKIIEIEALDDGHIKVPLARIDELIDGLNMAKKLAL